MEPYESKQTGWWAFGIAAALATLGAWLAIRHGLAGRPESLVGIVIVFAAVALANFGVLTVRVTASEVRWFFGPGLFGKSVALDRIRAVEARRSAWYWGWGIRWTPRGWLWRSSGLDVVWIELADGKRVGVGTADPEGLASAIRRRLDAVEGGPEST